MRVVTIPDTVPGTGPVLMLNLLKFADRRLYIGEYLPAFKRTMERLGLEAKVNLFMERRVQLLTLK